MMMMMKHLFGGVGVLLLVCVCVRACVRVFVIW